MFGEQRPIAFATTGADQLADALAPEAGRAELAAPGPQAPRQQVQRIFLGETDGAVYRMGNAGSAAGRLSGADLGGGDGEGGQGRVRLDKSRLRGDASGGRLLGEHRELLLDGLEGADRA